LTSDLAQLLRACVDGRVTEAPPVTFSDDACVTVVMASGGYPGSYRTGLPITGLDVAGRMDGVTVFHAGTRIDGEHVVTAGGRVLAAACTPGADAPVGPEASPTAAAAVVPSIPRPELPSAGTINPITEQPDPPAAAGAVILIHLQGPTTDVAATDLVVRTDDGQELDRFRLPGATAVHAGQGGRHALVQADGDRWARYDATTGVLSLLSFAGAAPSTAPAVVGATAWWADPAGPWLARLDTGVTTSLDDQVGEGATITATIDGSHLLVDGDADHLVDTAEGTSRRSLPSRASTCTSPAGVVPATPDPSGARVTTP
jgi:hypothetical protein